ncbi:MAG: nucleotidyltransferase domain-containing protein [Bdellovibrionaceae bacterium]|nr:nucleotidyltransferase domain-containing protein [Pseudobdellovibrionaceae bacterium]
MELSAQSGLNTTIINKIKSIFKSYAQIEQVILYGSRAKGNYKNGSDIDLSIKSKTLDLTALLKIENEIDDLLLPYKVDLNLFNQLNNANLIDHINRVGLVFYP